MTEDGGALHLLGHKGVRLADAIARRRTNVGDHDDTNHHPPPVPPVGAGEGLFGTAPARRLRSLLGINEELLRFAWPDARYYTIVAFLAVQIACLAAVSMTLALTFMLGPGSTPRALAAGAGWGMLIFSLDLLMLIPEPAKRGEKVWPRHARMFMRVLLAFLLGVLIAEPFVATLLRRDVDRTEAQAAEVTNTSAATSFTEAEAAEEKRFREQLGINILAANDAVTVAKNEETAAKDREAAQQELCNNEIAFGSGQRNPGRGNVAEPLCAPLEGPEGFIAQREAATTTREEAEEALQTAIDDVDSDVANHMTEWRKAHAPESVVYDPDSLGVWDRIRKTNDLMGRWHLVVAGVLIVLDCLPVIYKWFKGVTDYETRLHAAVEDGAHGFGLEVETARERRTNRREAMAPIEADAVARHARHWAIIEDARRKLAFRLELERIKGKAAAAGAPTDWIKTIDPAGGSTNPVASGTRQVGETVTVDGHTYTLTELVGQGGFAEVWRVDAAPDGAIQERHTEIVAKLAFDHENAKLALSEEATQYRRFGLGPSASLYPRVFRAADDGIIMEFYPRLSLDRWLFLPDGKTRPLTYETLFTMYDQLATTLNSIWDNRLVHGDGKPQNVLVAGRDATDERGADPVRLLVADLGSMVPYDGTARFQTPFFSPLEILRGEAVTASTDIFSFFGCISYFILSGGQPAWWDLAGEGGVDPNDRERVQALLAKPPRPLVEYNPTIPRELARQVEMWLDPVPSRRVGGSAQQLLTLGQIRELLRKQIEDLGPVLSNRQIIRGNAASGPTTEPPPERL